MLASLMELTAALSKSDIKKLLIGLSVPESVCDKEDCDPLNFLLAMRGWKNFDPFSFYQSLKVIRDDLVSLALKIEWLCVDTAPQPVFSIENFIGMLKKGLSIAVLKIININFYSGRGSDDVRFKNTIQLIFEKHLIQKDLVALFQLLTELNLVHLVAKLEPYKEEFENMKPEDFISEFKEALFRSEKRVGMWGIYVKSYITNQFQFVKQLLGRDKQVSLEYVFVDLTILKQKPRYVSLEDETTYNDIAYLTKIANKEVDISPVDLTEEFVSCDISHPEIWCFIGNIGSGKTFLCNRIALTFGNNELSKFLFTLYIPCRNLEWHDMESFRIESGQPITTDSITQWLRLGLPVGPSWAADLAEHITDIDGEGLLLIIDGLDEFTKDVSFEKTLLFILLTRQALSKSFILLTSRPHAWIDISTSHLLHNTTLFQVLGFSPAQRDLYFKKQFDEDSILKRCTQIFHRHDEMKQVSLIPIIASLFSALFKTDRLHTLTQFYCELTLYMIRWQLFRMGLEKFTLVNELSDLDSGVLECLHGIGFIAYQGVANRDLISTNEFPLRVEEYSMNSHRLGLTHEYGKLENNGLLTKVWTFPHLTLQEFTGAIWLSSTKWHDQCLSVRYIVHTGDVFSLFRMVVRFLCGLLSDRSMNTLLLLYKHLTPRPVPVDSLPECVQLRLEGSRLLSYTDWEEFTERIIQLSEILFESDSEYIYKHFSSCRRFLPCSVCFYIPSSVTPNEWVSFLKSLPLFEHIHLVYVDTNYVTPEQFFNLTASIKKCSVGCLALKFSANQEILNYANVLQHAQLSNTKLSLNLESCTLIENKPIEFFSSCPPAHTLSGLSLFRNEIPPNSLSLLSNQPSTCHNFKYGYNSTFDLDVLLSVLSSPTINGLHLYDIPTEYHQQLFSLQLSNIRELTWNAGYSILPHINHLTSLSYLDISHGLHHHIYNLSDSILHLLSANRDSIKVLKLQHLQDTGLSSLDIFFSCLQACTNLVHLELGDTNIVCDDDTLWCSMVRMFRNLLVLNLYDISLGDSGMLRLCKGLVCNQTFRSLEVIQCELSSDSCTPLTHLIPTLRQLKSLRINQLSEPETELIEILRRTADEYYLKHYFK